MTIDVEGHDFSVLKSNNWELFRPELVLIECFNANMDLFFESEVHNFLNEKGYVFFAKTINTVFYKNS